MFYCNFTENWDKWHGDDQNDVGEHDENEPHCEDDNFNVSYSSWLIALIL